MNGRWSRNVVVKVFGIGFLALVMLIPLAEVHGLIGERASRAEEATRHVAERWGGEQRLGGAVLVVPVRHRVKQDKDWVVVEEQRFVLPDTLTIAATLATGRRSYGIYDTAIYTAEAKVEGRFAPADLAEVARSGDAQWDRAEVRVPIADVRGIRRVSKLSALDRNPDFGPDTGGVGGIAAISAALPLDATRIEAPLPFAFELTLAGTERFALLPLARRTEVTVSGTWPDPGFDGAFLPARRRVSAEGFEGEWQVLDLNRSLAQSWSGRDDISIPLAQSAFGIRLTQPASAYQRNERASKYGVLFIALTFVAFFLFEVLRGLRVHPVQYVLIGLSLATFYVVLLALSEQIGFGPAYAIAAAAVVLMIAGYASAVLAARRSGFALGALLAFVYAVLYGLVVSEDYALLMGASTLLATVAALMFLTRRVDWYAVGAAGAR